MNYIQHTHTHTHTQQCEFCAKPIAAMGNSRHHCRKCGAALCSDCWIRRTNDGQWKVCRFSDACVCRLELSSRSKKLDNVSSTKSKTTSRKVSTSRRYRWKRFLTSNVVDSTTTANLQQNKDEVETRSSNIESTITKTTEIDDDENNDENRRHHITKVSVLPKDEEIEEICSSPTREQQKLANRMSKLGSISASHLAMALLRNDTEQEEDTSKKKKKKKKKKRRSFHIRGMSIFHDIGNKDADDDEEEEKVEDVVVEEEIRVSGRGERMFATPSPIQTSRRQLRRRHTSHLDDHLTSTLMTKGEDDFSACLYGDDYDDDNSSTISTNIVSSPPDLTVHVSLVDENDEDELESSSHQRRKRQETGSPGRVRGISIFDDIDTRASGEIIKEEGCCSEHEDEAEDKRTTVSPTFWRRLRAFGSDTTMSTTYL